MVNDYAPTTTTQPSVSATSLTTTSTSTLNFSPTGAWQWTMTQSGGYVVNGTLQVQSPAHLADTPLLPGFSSQNEILTDCSGFDPTTDAVAPAELTLTNETPSFSTTASVTFYLDPESPAINFNSDPPGPAVNLAADVSYSSGDSCGAISTPNPGPGWGVSFSNLGPGSSGTSYTYLTISNFYSPDYPYGNTALWGDCILWIEDLGGPETEEAGQWTLTSLTGPGMSTGIDTGYDTESIPLDGKPW